jgi:hypothetical protein
MDTRWSKATARTLEGKQVKCLTSDEGHVWIYGYDRLSSKVRSRLANSPFNICPVCLTIQVRRKGKETDVDYFRRIQEIEQELEKA